jgi:ubiquinone/menaquinone biosynthesis C-methylase UbiE
MDKEILDATCGSRMMWFDKENPEVVFADKRTESHILCDGRVLEIKPDVEMDFTDMPFPDASFSLIVFDPPHMKSLGLNSWMAKKYGKLSGTWQQDIEKGFTECMRVLKPNGTLIFKWNESEVKVSKILEIIGAKPLFGHTSGRQSKTIWMTFFKSA